MANGNGKQRVREHRHIISPYDPKTGERSYETDDATSGKWLSDIFDSSEGGRTAVCSVCTERFKSDYYRGTGVFPVCTKCQGVRTRTSPNSGFLEGFMEWDIELGPDPRAGQIGGDIDDESAETYRQPY
jgi:hypothetical protein